MNWVRRRLDWLLKSFIIVLLKNWVLKFIKIIKECHFIKKISDIFYEMESHFLNRVTFFVKRSDIILWNTLYILANFVQRTISFQDQLVSITKYSFNLYLFLAY